MLDEILPIWGGDGLVGLWSLSGCLGKDMAL